MNSNLIAATLEPEMRAKLAAKILKALEEAVPGSAVSLRGSLANGNWDVYSDIDVGWVVPDANFEECLAHLEELLGRVQPLESFRFDPDLKKSAKHRLVFVRFQNIPLFWRLDLDILAASVADQPDYDLNNPAVSDFEGWSWPESALNNVVAAVKAILRDKPETAQELVARAYQQLGLTVSNSNLKQAMFGLVKYVRAAEPALTGLAARVETLIRQTPKYQLS